MLWLGLVLGVGAVAAVHRWIGLHGLWIGAAVAHLRPRAPSGLPRAL